ncbi:hypothetical protein EST38_g141 [Candolleomyces aberdarensis]|uniref:Uncharacterized protein n=1 Tax=Candolleomyces aberdarensis TaxID=2316362 RepID=A0A4V1Q5I3_9AGAR|nr:hypothetical protein EST38_g141 [Candolleomyces aberdarensis]
MDIGSAKTTGTKSPGRWRRMLNRAAEKLRFRPRRDKKRHAASGTPAGKSRKKRGQPSPSDQVSLDASTASKNHDPEVGVPMDGIETVPLETRSNGVPEGKTESRGGSRGLWARIVRNSGDVERIRRLETDLEESRATVERSGRIIQEQTDTVEDQKKTIDTIRGERERILANMKDQETTWGAEKTDLEGLVGTHGVAIEKRDAEIQNLKKEQKEESNRRKESGIRTQTLEKALREATGEADRAKMQLNELKREFAAMQRHADATTKLLNTRTEELNAAQAFLTTADECSGADFSRMVEQLNDDIYQCAVLVADAVIEPDAVQDNLAEARKPYEGDTRRLLLAFDIGTTFSGISFSILDPGYVPEIRPVTRWHFIASLARVIIYTDFLRVIYYDQTGSPCAIGAETLAEGIEADAEEYGWTKAHWFKLHLRPKPRESLVVLEKDPVPPLPAGKTVTEVLADYIEYLHCCAKQYIEETHHDGVKLWDSFKDDIIYVMTHPNGWGGPQQAQMREAAIMANIIPDSDKGRSQITFVTEGEASLQFCLSNGLSISGNSENSGVLIVDAGGGTIIDVTSYRRLSNGSFEEIAIPGCYFQGSIYVAQRAGKYFHDLLSGTRFEDDIPTLKTRFDRNTKHVFRKDDEPLHIQFASHRDRDPDLNIRAGRLTLSGETVAKFFEPSVSCIVEAIKTQQQTAHFPIKSVFLVGGFSASAWLYEKVQKAIEPLGITVSRPDTHVNKAVSNGAVSFYIDGAVSARVSRLTYGIETSVDYNPTNPLHKTRGHLVKPHSVHGKPVLLNHFSCILPKNTRVRETTEFRQRFCYYTSDVCELRKRKHDILAYCGGSSHPPWINDEAGQYVSVCTVKADTSSVKPEVIFSPHNRSYYCKISFDIVLQFGMTELKAQIAYWENGVEKRGPAQVVYGA